VFEVRFKGPRRECFFTELALKSSDPLVEAVDFIEAFFMEFATLILMEMAVEVGAVAGLETHGKSLRARQVPGLKCTLRALALM
jgi:hypothetical protein